MTSETCLKVFYFILFICRFLQWRDDDKRWQLRVGVWEFCVLHTLWTFCFFWMKGIATCYCHLSFLLQLFVKAFANFRKWQRAVLFSARATGPCGLCCRCFYLRTSERGDIMVSVRVTKCRGAFPAFLVFNVPIRSNTCFSRLPSSCGRTMETRAYLLTRH